MKFRKGLIIFFVFLMLLFNTLYPYQKTQAFAFAIPPAVGAVALGAIAIGGALTYLGSENGEEISSFGNDWWNKTTQASKDFVTAIGKWLPGGRTIDPPSLRLDLKDLTLDQEQFMIDSATTISNGSRATKGRVVSTEYPNIFTSYNSSAGTRTYKITDSSSWYVVRGKNFYITKDLVLSNYFGNNKILVNNYFSSETGTSVSGGTEAYTNMSTDLYNYVHSGDYVDAFMTEALPIINSIGSQHIAMISEATADAILNDYGNTRTRVAEAWEGMKDAGLVIDGSAILEANPNITWDADQQTFADRATGAAVGTGDLVMPKPRVYENDGTKVIGFPVVDGGVVTTDGTAIGEGAQTGEGTGTEIPPFTVPEGEPARIDLTPLYMTGDLFKQKFPFSIPWDLQSQFGIFDVSAQTPVFSIDRTLFSLDGEDFRIKFSLDMSKFETIATMSRWFLIIAFDIALILAIRRVMPE